MRLAFALTIAFILSAAAFAQQRQDTFTPEAVDVTTLQLEPLEDGGCAARWCGEVHSDDGGAVLRACTGSVELKATINQNRCSALAAAGAGRVLRELRFNVDGGAP